MDDPDFMALFAAGEPSTAWRRKSCSPLRVIIPVMIAAGYDALTAVAIIMLGAGVGTLGLDHPSLCDSNNASNAAGVPFTNGMPLRFLILGVGWLTCVVYVMRYAERVKKDPSKSLVADLDEEQP